MPSQAACLQNLGLGRLGQAAWLGLAWLAFFEADSSRVKPRPKPKTKPTQAELGLAWLGLPFSKWKQAVQAVEILRFLVKI